MDEHDTAALDTETQPGLASAPLPVSPSPAPETGTPASGGPRAGGRAGKPSPWLVPAVALALLGILALGAAFRATNLDWDEDLALHPDERFLTMVMTSITIPEPCRGFIPHWNWPAGVDMPQFQRDLPGCISAYLDSATSTMNPRNVGHSLWVYGSLPITVLRVVTEALNIQNFYEVTRAGRVFSVLTELVTIVLAFFLGKRLLDWRLGLLGALLLSLSALNIQNAHFFTVDTMTTLATLACVYLAVVIAEGKGSWGLFTLLGLAFGTALSCKINVASFALIIVLAGGVRLWRATWAREDRPFPWSMLAAAGMVGLSALAMFIVVAAGLAFLAVLSHSTFSLFLVACAVVLSAGLAVLLWWLRAHLLRNRPGFWPALLETSVGLLLAAILAIGVFRLAQPDAFLAPEAAAQGGGVPAFPAEGLARQVFDARFLDNMATVQGLVSGEVDYYPSHQWTNRTALLFPWQNMVVWGMGLPLGLAAWAGVALASWRFFARREMRFIVPLAWTVFFFLYQGSQFVKTMRYFLPLYPLLGLFAGYLLLMAWDWARRREKGPAPGGREPATKPAARLPWRTILAGLLLGLVVGGTFLWAWGFVQIYRRPVTRAVASRWIYKNIPTDRGAVLQLSNGTQVAVAIPNAQEYGPAWPPSITPFTPADGGTLTAVTIAHLQDTRDSPEEERLEVAIAADRDGQQVLARSEIVGNFTGPAGDAAPGTATFDALPLEAGRTYYLRLQGRQGFVRTWAVALANETWDDPVPMRVDGKDGFAPTAIGYRGLMMQPYGEDTPQKWEEMLHQLANTDYVCLTSNRLYDSIPRLPMRYPVTTRYYQALFDGSLGFERVATFTSYPTLFALGIPAGIADKSDEERAQMSLGWTGLAVPDQGAEEAFSVYDHPKVQIFRRTAAFDLEQARALLTDGIEWDSIARIRPIEVPAYRDLMLTETERKIQQEGGTWSDIFPPSGLPTKVALPLWLLVVEVLGLAALPLVQVLFGRLADGGYLPAKAVGILLLGYLSWLLAASKVLPYTRWSILGVLFFLLLLGLAVGRLRRRELLALWQTRRRLLLLEEGLFLLCFLIFLLIRLGNPDLWHPWFGGEKPMDLAYLTAVVRSTTFPPYDPWFAGGYLNYYYFGQILIGTLIKLTGIEIAVAYNLALPLLFGLTCGGAFTVVYHLVWRKKEHPAGWDRRAIVCGLAGVAFLAFLGNIGEFFLIVGKAAELSELSFASSIPGLAPLVKAIAGLPEAFRRGLPIDIGSWYWAPSRIILRGEINEFPFFTFLYADLHAHMYALPYTLLALTATVSLIKDRERRGDFLWGLLPSPWVVLGLGLVLGCLRAAHQWDLPTYLIVAAAGWGVALYERHRANWRTFAGPFVLAGALLLLSALLFLPFWARYGSYYNQLLPWTGERTHLWEYAAINGLSLFVLVSYLLSESFGPGAREKPLHLVGLLVRYWDRLPQLTRRLRRWGGRAVSRESEAGRRALLGLPALITGAVAIALLVLFFLLPLSPPTDLPAEQFSPLRLLGQRLIGVLVPLIVLAAALFFRRHQTGETRFIAGLILLGLGISVGVELITVRGDIGRMNTFFRFYFQLWILWAIASAAVLPRLWQRSRRWSTVACRLWHGALFLLIALCALYPPLATPAKVQDRFPASSQGPGLDGEAFLQTEVLPEEHGPVLLAEDYAAIRWLRANVAGTPVILEGSLGTGYRNFGSRISVYTGLPTVLGWDWHQTQQRALVSEQVHHSVVQTRLADVSALYNGTDIDTTVALLRRYRVSYIVVGQLERYYYQPEGLAKFERMVGTYLERVYPPAETIPAAGPLVAPDPTPYPSPTTALQGTQTYPAPAASSTAYPAPAEEKPLPQPAALSGGTIIYRVLSAVWNP